MRAHEFLGETAPVTTFAGKDPSSFKSPNGGTASMVLVTGQGSRYLITTDGMVLRDKSFHANTGGEDKGIQSWSQHIEFYDPTDSYGGSLTFPQIVTMLLERGYRLALRKTASGERTVLVLVGGVWRPAMLSDAFPKSFTASNNRPVAGKYSTSPKLGWHPMDYDLRGDGTLHRVHPGSPVTHGIKVVPTVTEAKGRLHPDQANAMPGVDRTRDPSGIDRTYHMNRLWMAMALADGKSTVAPKGMDSASWAEKYNTIHPYTKEEENMVQQAIKLVPTDYKREVRDRRSIEPDDTQKVSPVKGFKGWK